jgi:alpha-2-macroglobulin
MLRRLLVLLLLTLTLPAHGFELPGLWQDSQRYREELERRHPAGGTAQQRQAAEARAATAERQGNWAAAAEAWEARVALGNTTPEHWLSLARAQLRRTPPDGSRALRAAWQNFVAVPGGAAEIPSLLLIADALAAQNRPLPRLTALEAVLQRDPSNTRHQQALAAARREVGVLVNRINT